MESKGKIIAIAGNNASGKTLFVERMRRQMGSQDVRYVSFCDSYGTATDRAYYLQQRWNQHDIDQETPTVENALERSFLLSGPDTNERRSLQHHLYELFALRPLLGEYVISLSSGELRKMQLIKTLMARPQTLIIDNPFIGLDVHAREQLRLMLKMLHDESGLQIYLVVARLEDIPEFTDDIIWLTPEDEFASPPHPLSDEKQKLLLGLGGNEGTTESIVDMHHVSIRYGERTILDNINWNVSQGERWALSGKNGSGKSTLLSLICADNPQGYACDISLFGRRRGTGETIWDIKQRIGYVSPEMHRSYQRNLPALQIVASGLKDTIGLYTHANAAEKDTCRWWMSMFGLQGKEERPFLTLSSGEQRLVLLARAFVKDPALLILDEPMHGLDAPNQKTVKDIIDTFCKRPGKTLIMVSHYEHELPNCINRRKEL